MTGYGPSLCPKFAGSFGCTIDEADRPMTDFSRGVNSSQSTLVPEALDHYVAADDSVCAPTALTSERLSAVRTDAGQRPACKACGFHSSVSHFSEYGPRS